MSYKSFITKISVIVMVGLLALGLLAGCGNKAADSSGGTSGQAGTSGAAATTDTSVAEPSGYTNINADEAYDMMNSGDKFTLVDVRTKDEYTAEKIDGAINIPVDQIKDMAPSMLTDKNATIIVYCRSGVRSATASQELADMGYTNIYNMTGGILGWGYGTAKP